MNDTQIYDLMISNHIRSYSFLSVYSIKGGFNYLSDISIVQAFFRSQWFQTPETLFTNMENEDKSEKLDRKLLVFSREKGGSWFSSWFGRGSWFFLDPVGRVMILSCKSLHQNRNPHAD